MEIRDLFRRMQSAAWPHKDVTAAQMIALTETPTLAFGDLGRDAAHLVQTDVRSLIRILDEAESAFGISGIADSCIATGFLDSLSTTSMKAGSWQVVRDLLPPRCRAYLKALSDFHGEGAFVDT
ncbi:MAG: hypothetical protein HEQ23_08785 [Tepidisphaera sp.]